MGMVTRGVRLAAGLVPLLLVTAACAGAVEALI